METSARCYDFSSFCRVTGALFFIVRYGDDEQLLFNMHCRVKVLLETIKKRCKCSPEEIIDLADEHAHIMNLAEQPDSKYASMLLQPRMSYILVRANVLIDERTGDTHKTYTALLEGLSDSNPEFLMRLAKRVHPDGTRDRKDYGSRGSTRTGKRKKGHMKPIPSD